VSRELMQDRVWEELRRKRIVGVNVNVEGILVWTRHVKPSAPGR
jgi:hypothetical protein